MASQRGRGVIQFFFESSAANTRPRHELLAPPLLLLGPLFHEIRLHEYPLFRAEVLLVAAVTVLVGVLLGLAIQRARPALRLTMVIVVLAIVWDLYSAGESLRWAVISVGTIFLVVLALRTHITTIVFAVSLPVLLSTLLPPIETVEATTTTNASAPVESELPPVFHIVLDEHAGLAGLRDDPALVRELRAWYERHGFLVFPNAYSSYYETYNALSNAVNLAADRRDARHLRVVAGSAPILRENRYFDAMRARGYGIRVYQSDYLDFCTGEAAGTLRSCFTYPANSLAYAAGMSLPVSARTRLLAHYVLGNRSWFFDRAVALYEHGMHSWLADDATPAVLRAGRGSHVAPPASVVLDRIERDLAHGGAGTLFFAHLILPHSPYQYDAECGALERLRDRFDRHSPSSPQGVDNTPASRARRLALYGGQVRCLMRELGSFFGKLDSLGLHAGSVVILHGDHGSRIVLHRPEGASSIARLTSEDLLGSFSTLFAVKAPGMRAGFDTTTAGIDELLAAVVAAGVGAPDLSLVERREPTVFILERPRRDMIPLPYPDD